MTLGMTRGWVAAAAAFAALALSGPTTARAALIVGDTANSESGLGNFSATLTYSASDSTNAVLTIAITNTSPAANGGFLTAFVLNNPDDLITGVSLASTSATFDDLLFGDDSENGAPFGQFDLGATTQGSFVGGGPPGNGIAVGDTETFTFTLTGTMLDTLSDASFLNTFSVPPGAGQGVQFFVARFRGFEDDGSDKVPGVSVIPEPGTMTLALSGLGLVGLGLSRRMAKRRAR